MEVVDHFKELLNDCDALIFWQARLDYCLLFVRRAALGTHKCCEVSGAQCAAPSALQLKMLFNMLSEGKSRDEFHNHEDSFSAFIDKRVHHLDNPWMLQRLN